MNGNPHGLPMVNTLPLLLSEDRIVDQHPQNLRDGQRWGRISEGSLKIPFLTGILHGLPDGKHIAFTATVNEHTNIYVIDTDGQEYAKTRST